MEKYDFWNTNEKLLKWIEKGKENYIYNIKNIYDYVKEYNNVVINDFDKYIEDYNNAYDAFIKKINETELKSKKNISEKEQAIETMKLKNE